MSDNENWIACPPGTLTKVKNRIPAATQGRKLQPYIAGAALAMLVGAVLFGFSLMQDSSRAKFPTALRCQDVMPLLEGYHDGSLSEGERLQVEQHLAKCEGCRKHYQSTCLQGAAAYRAGLGPLEFWLLALH